MIELKKFCSDIRPLLTVNVDFIWTLFREGSGRFHYVFTFRFRNYFLGTYVPQEIVSLDALVETKIFSKTNCITQGK